MSDPKEVARGVAAVERIKAALEADEENWWVLLDDVADERCEEIDAMVSAMTPRMKEKFLHAARAQWGAYEDIFREILGKNEDPRGWRAIEKWSFRQPFDRSGPTLSEEELARRVGLPVLLAILPLLSRMSVDEVLDRLHFSWRDFRLANYTHGMRRGIDVILATARAHGQDETPFHRLMEWGAAHPMAPKE